MTITQVTPALGADLDFTAEHVIDASTGPGVYVLSRRGRVVMIDGAPNLRVELAAHQGGDRGRRTASATEFRVHETTLAGVGDRREQLMEEYRRTHNSNVPPGNRAGATQATDYRPRRAVGAHRADEEGSVLT